MASAAGNAYDTYLDLDERAGAIAGTMAGTVRSDPTPIMIIAGAGAAGLRSGAAVLRTLSAEIFSLLTGIPDPRDIRDVKDWYRGGSWKCVGSTSDVDGDAFSWLDRWMSKRGAGRAELDEWEAGQRIQWATELIEGSGTRLRARPEFDPDMPFDTMGTSNPPNSSNFFRGDTRVGPAGAASDRDALETIVHEDIHHRFYRAGIPDEGHTTPEMEQWIDEVAGQFVDEVSGRGR